MQERSPSDDSQQGYQFPNAVLSNTDRQLNGQNDEQQERSPPSDDGQQGYQSPNAVTSNTDTQLKSQNNELQERSPSDDSQQGYQSPNAVTSNTDRQLNGQNDEQQERSPPVMMVSKDTSRQMLLYPIQTHSSINDEMQERSPSDDSQQGYQSPNAVTSNTDRQLNDTYIEKKSH
ncbi:hypothetical protein MAR_026319 [Mya arenaria]|uniref:Uncharacterized protein n=1 Tax=Mya arenaria TaxID=6604 RepID=A0ABY7EUR5_MYAAR|nr:hypothetical protein MAR_026319 [Mya arenaria]